MSWHKNQEVSAMNQYLALPPSITMSDLSVIADESCALNALT